MDDSLDELDSSFSEQMSSLNSFHLESPSNFMNIVHYVSQFNHSPTHLFQQTIIFSFSSSQQINMITQSYKKLTNVSLKQKSIDDLFHNLTQKADKRIF